MKTINSVRKEYESMVTGPGKFESELPWCPYFWDFIMSGELSEEFHFANGQIFSAIEIQSSDAAVFHELCSHIGQWFVMHETDAGFVTGWIVNETGLNELRKFEHDEAKEIEGLA